MLDRRIWLTKFHSDWQKINISAAYFIVRTDKISKSVQMIGMSKKISTSLFNDISVIYVTAHKCAGGLNDKVTVAIDIP